MALAWQPSLLGDEPPGFDPGLGGLVRRDLAGGAWYDVAEGWAHGADRLFSLGDPNYALDALLSAKAAKETPGEN